MSRRRRKRTPRFGIFLVFLSIAAVIGACIISWVMQLENFREEKDAVRSFLYEGLHQNTYNGKSLLVIDRANGDVFISKNEKELRLPASLAKLFVIEYAATLADLNSIVLAGEDALLLTKADSSVADIETKEYFLHNLFAAMLVPSGNDAAYVVADYCGGLLAPEAESTEARIRVFMAHLNDYLRERGYSDTVLYDPSGYDMDARTTVFDLRSVVDRLLEFPWFRDMISQSLYTATLPDGSSQSWENTNVFLDPSSDYYNEHVMGVKTGSLSGDYDLIVLYLQHGKEFLICSLGSQSNSSRYDDVVHIIQTIDESDYLTR